MAEELKELEYTINGMDCADCALTIERGVTQLEGVVSCRASFASEKMYVYGSAANEDIAQRVREMGYSLKDNRQASQPEKAQKNGNFFSFMMARKDTRLALLAMLMIFPGLVLEELAGINHPLIDLFSIGALLIAGYPVARSAWQSIRVNKDVNINVLMVIAGVGAMVIGAFTEGGMVMVLFALGDALEGFVSNRARDSIRSLVEVMPQEAVLIGRSSDGETYPEGGITVAVDELDAGDLIRVKPGERIPMDGRVIGGGSFVDQSPITGESRLIEKVVGEDIFASSINGEGVLDIEVTQRVEDNTISRLISMVEVAQEKRLPAQRFIDRFSRYYTPSIVVAAILTAVVPPLFFGQPFWGYGPGSGWLYRGLTLLVVGCPCALVISTPVSVISAIANAARNGVLIKGGVYLEKLGDLQAVAFDKTGTITEGRPSVVAVRSVDAERPCLPMYGAKETFRYCKDCVNLIALAGAVERQSEHPIASAIVAELERDDIAAQHMLHADDVKALSGRGIVGVVNGKKVTIGSHTFFDENIPHESFICEAANHDASKGFTPMMVSEDGVYKGIISVADTVRESSQEAIRMLKQFGVATLVMLTGDNVQTAQSVGNAIGIASIHAELLPEDKVIAVQNLQRQYDGVAMVGDGINDAPALATADIGVAMGGRSGAAQAMETADITLMGGDLRQLAFAMRLSRSTMNIIKMNVAFTLLVKLVFMVMVISGVATMWMAVLADTGLSILVILNGMRLLNVPRARDFIPQ
jgi:Zn2+/Cd2+-exporting ATPase